MPVIMMGRLKKLAAIWLREARPSTSDSAVRGMLVATVISMKGSRQLKAAPDTRKQAAPMSAVHSVLTTPCAATIGARPTPASSNVRSVRFSRASAIG